MLSIIANTRTGIKNNAATFINSFASMAGFLVKLGKVLYQTLLHTVYVLHTDNHWLSALKVLVNKDILRYMTFLLIRTIAMQWNTAISTTQFIFQIGYRQVEFLE